MINYILIGLQTPNFHSPKSMAFSDKISSPNFWVTCFLRVMRSHSLGWLVIQKRHPLLKHSEHFYINSRSFGWVSPKSESQFSELVHKQLMWSRWFLHTFDVHVWIYSTVRISYLSVNIYILYILMKYLPHFSTKVCCNSSIFVVSPWLENTDSL